MKSSKIVGWHIVAFILFIALYLLAILIWPDLDMHRTFSIYTAGAFFVLSLLITMLSSRFSNHHNPYYFSWVTLMSVLVKLVVGIGLVFYYTKTQSLDNRLYVISFILAYVVFMACEIILLQHIIKLSKRSWSN